MVTASPTSSASRRAAAPGRPGLRTEPQAPVLVVGAGPTGLACALEFTRLGLPVRIVERTAARSPFSRAVAVNPRTLELLDASGASDAIRAAARPIRGVTVHPPAGGDVDIVFSAALGRPAEMLALPQNETERLLEETLERLGVAVERGREFSRLAGRDGLVEAEIGDERIAASWVVGADGAHSAVRKAIGATFEGWTDPGEWSLADVRLDWPFQADRAHLFLRPDGGLFAIELEPGVTRLVTMRGGALDALPAGAVLRETLWRSEFHVAYRVAEPMHRGRVALAGDAAHIESPAGARGMNLGIEDGVLLARRIAEGGVDGWTAERRPVALRVVRTSRDLARLPTARGPLARFLRTHVAGRALRLRFAQARLVRFVLGADG